VNAAEVRVAVPGGELVGHRAGSGAPVLLLHGGPGMSSSYLDPLAEELSARFDTIWYQQRGIPPSAVGGPYSVGGHVDDALAMLGGCGLDRAWIVGHSWGGYLAMALAAAAPDRCLGYAAIDALGPIGDGGMAAFDAWIGRALDEATVRRLQEIEAEPVVDGAEPATSMPLYWHGYFADPDSAPPMPELQVNGACFEQVFGDAMRINESATLIDRLRGINLPALLVAGSESGLRGAAEETAAAIGGARLVIVEGAGHFPWVEAPGSIVAAVDQLVRTPRAHPTG
jgi:proline iminopeptidase